MFDRTKLSEALGDEDILPVPDGVTVGSLGDDSVLMPEAQWRTLQNAARKYLALLPDEDGNYDPELVLDLCVAYEVGYAGGVNYKPDQDDITGIVAVLDAIVEVSDG